tara:strand:- start:1805 stop:2227 length:423 start_codon:yes stop_codon:yes gene_type:complete
MNFHESHHRQHVRSRGSARSFGFIVTAVFFLIGLAPLLDESPPRWWALAIAFTFAGIAIFWPRSLRRVNELWISFGLMLHKVMTPLVFGILFFGAVTPVALLMKIFRKDPLKRMFDLRADSYWIDRDPPGPDRKTMRDQF